jgi:hypothetical protein
VVNRLTGDPAVVDDDVETFSAGGRGDCPAKPRQKRTDLAGELVRELGENRMVCLGQEQSVPLANRVDVQNGNGCLGLDQPGRGYFPADDFAKNAMMIVVGFHGGLPLRSRCDHGRLGRGLDRLVGTQQGNHGHGRCVSLSDLGKLVDAGVAA